MPEPTSWVFRVGADLPGGGTIVEPTIDSNDFTVCPHCGNEDIGMWADDGEADLADWMDCHQCGLEAALVKRDDIDHTQNGLPWKALDQLS